MLTRAFYVARSYDTEVGAPGRRRRYLSARWSWRLKNGLISEFREYQGDEQREDRFWS